jgi:hypothetical protein
MRGMRGCEDAGMRGRGDAGDAVALKSSANFYLGDKFFTLNYRN